MHQIGKVNLTGMRILVAEPDPAIGDELTDALRSIRAHAAGPFQTEAAALQSIAADRPDGVVMDVILDRGPPHALLRELRSRQIPFVVFTSRTQSEVGPEFEGAMFVQKPVSFRVLAEALARVLPDRHGADRIE